MKKSALVSTIIFALCVFAIADESTGYCYITQIQNVSGLTGQTNLMFSPECGAPAGAYFLKESVLESSYKNAVATALAAIASGLKVYFGWNSETHDVTYLTIVNE